MSILTLETNTIRNKKNLVTLYLNQYNENYIRRQINEILMAERTSLPEAKRCFQKRLSTKEVLIFIYKNGVPDKYVLSDEMRNKLTEFRKSFMQSNHTINRV